MPKKKIKATSRSDQKKPATAQSLRELARVLRKFASEFENVADMLDSQGGKTIMIRGRVGVDQNMERLDGYLSNAIAEAGHLGSVREPKDVYHAEGKQEQ